MSKIVYVLTNEAMPGLVKIGFADNVKKRISDLSRSSGVPLSFELFYAARVEDASVLEKKLHQIFSKERINRKREFFRVEPEQVVRIIGVGNFEEVKIELQILDKDEGEALENAKSRRSRINLEKIGIKINDILVFSRDDLITATFVGRNQVIFQGTKMSHSTAALEALRQKGYLTPTASGSEYWMYNGELLDKRRRRLEMETFEGAEST